jgi:hypothetical protein
MTIYQVINYNNNSKYSITIYQVINYNNNSRIFHDDISGDQLQQ